MSEEKRAKIGIDGAIMKERVLTPPDMSPISLDGGYCTTLLIVRHGESVANAIRVCLGHTNLDLSERGYRQAERTAELLSGVKIDAIYSSDLMRAYNTALPHARLRGMPVNATERLREIYMGEWENKPVSELETVWHDEFVIGWRQNFGTFCPPSGESVQHLAERIEAELLRIARENEGKTVLIASHAAAIRSFFARISGIAPERAAAQTAFPENASVSVVYFDKERLIPGEYSHAAHLTDI